MDTDLTLFQFTIVIITLLLGGFSKGVTAIGLPSILTPSLAAIFGIQTAVPMVAIVTVTMNLLIIERYKGAWREVIRAWPRVAAGLLTIFGGVFVLHRGNQNIMALLLAVLAMAYVVLDFSGKQIKIPAHKINLYGVPMGLLAGFFQGTTGVCGPVVIAYMAGIKDFSKEAYFFAISLVFLLFSMNQVLGYVYWGMYTVKIVKMGLLAVIPVICSFYLGIWLQERLDIQKIKKATLVIISLSGLRLFVSNI